MGEIPGRRWQVELSYQVLKKLANLTAKSWQEWTFKDIVLIKGFAKGQHSVFASINLNAPLLPIHDPIFFRITA